MFQFNHILTMLVFSCYPLISQKVRNKLHITKNKYIGLCLKLNSRQHKEAKEIKRITLLQTKERQQNNSSLQKVLNIGMRLHHST